MPEGSVHLYYTNARASAAAPVQSVAGRGGVVVLTKTDVGLVNVDNTSDLNKPVSTATQTALNLKADLASPTFTGDPKASDASAGRQRHQHRHDSIRGSSDDGGWQRQSIQCAARDGWRGCGWRISALFARRSHSPN